MSVTESLRLLALCSKALACLRRMGRPEEDDHLGAAKGLRLPEGSVYRKP